MNFQLITGSILIMLFLLISCDLPKQEKEGLPKSNEEAISKGKAHAETYCSTCHIFPEPTALDKRTWGYVLPHMGGFLGMYRVNGVYQDTPRPDFFEKGKGGEQVVSAGIFPREQMLTIEEWESIVKYYLDSAPLSLPSPQKTSERQTLTGFELRFPQTSQMRYPMTCLVKIDPKNAHLYVGSAGTNTLQKFDGDGRLIRSFNLPGPPVHLHCDGESLRIIDIGSIAPSDDPRGKVLVSRESSNEPVVILEELPRPVFATYSDLDNDNRTDIVLCNYGNYLGSLEIIFDSGTDEITRNKLDSRPGSMMTQTVDLNRDGLPEIVALMAAGDEHIAIYHNLGGRQFRKQVVLRFPPYYGSTSFQMLDFDNDNDLDIVYTNGDNADYRPIPKPYHGIRIFINDGSGAFDERYFYPMNGCYKAIATDYNGDGTLDVAAISFFPDYSNSSFQDFVLLQNKGDFQFQAYSLPDNRVGRWAAMDVADIDNDGDQDLVLGSFSQGPTAVPEDIQKRYSSGPAFMILENTTKK